MVVYYLFYSNFQYIYMFLKSMSGERVVAIGLNHQNPLPLSRLNTDKKF